MKICHKRFHAGGIENYVVSLEPHEAQKLMTMKTWEAEVKISPYKSKYYHTHNIGTNIDRFGTKVNMVMYVNHDDDRVYDNCWIDIIFYTEHKKTCRTHARTMVKYAISTIDNHAHEAYTYDYDKDYYIA